MKLHDGVEDRTAAILTFLVGGFGLAVVAAAFYVMTALIYGG